MEVGDATCVVQIGRMELGHLDVIHAISICVLNVDISLKVEIENLNISY